MQYKKRLFLLVLILITAFSTFSCANKDNNPSDTQAAFNHFINDIFVDEVQTDSITLNYSLAEPEKYGIKDVKATLGDYSMKAMKEGLAVSENYLSALENFDYKKLTEDQKLTYDILKSYLEESMDASNLLLYQETLSPTTGIQAQLPVLLAEYNFYDKEDVEGYLDLLNCIPDYFNQIIKFEQQKSKAGLFMSDASVDDIVEQCNEFIEDKENNYLLDVFHEQIKSISNLSESEIKSYEAENKQIILEKVIPAYQDLVTGLTKLKGTGKNNGGLCGFPKGKEYYSYLVASTTGSSKTIEEINSLLDVTMNNSVSNMAKIIQKDTKAFDKVESLTYPYTDPEEIISYLKTTITKDFPELDAVECTIKYVHDSLEDSLSPAFYLTPPIDDFSENSIYINGGNSYDLSQIFTTLAHEGYPGHLYQTVYYNQQNPVPLRNLLSFGGYSEGWATYSELYSYHIAGLDETTADLLENNLIATLVMYAKVDIGVNYYGWDLSDTSEYLKNYGITNEKAIQEVHTSMIEEPANYLKYTLGYLEIMELKEKAQKKLGDNFNLKEFHEFILDIGPAQFDIINKRMDIWLK